MQEFSRQLMTIIDDYIATQLIYEICSEAERLQGISQMMWWCYQDHIQGEEANGEIGEEEDEV